MGGNEGKIDAYNIVTMEFNITGDVTVNTFGLICKALTAFNLTGKYRESKPKYATVKYKDIFMIDNFF